MEFDFRRLIRGTIDTRPFDTSRGEPERSLCSDLRDPARSACIYWEPNWWAAQLDISSATSTTEDRVHTMQKLCTQWDDEERDTCYAGIGFTLINMPHTTAASTGKICDLVFERDSTACKVGAAARIRTMGAGIPEALKVCAGSRGDTYKQCVSAAEGKIGHLVGFPAGVIW